MEGIGLDNMLGAEEVNSLFGDQAISDEFNDTSEKTSGEETPGKQGNIETDTTAEVDFSDFLGDQPESVGSEENSRGNGDSPESTNDPGTPQANPFSSFAKALRDEGVFPDLSDGAIDGVTDAASLRKMIDDENAKSLNERQRRIEKALNSGAAPEELQAYEEAISIVETLEKQQTVDTLKAEGEQGEKLRKQVMYLDYINKGLDGDEAVEIIQKRIEDGTDLEYAKKAFESCKRFYKNRIEEYQNGLEEKRKAQQASDEKKYANLKKNILDAESFFGGVKVDKTIRQKAYDSITKPVFKDEEGNYITAMQKYQKENPIEFMGNVALLYSLTDGFKNVEKLTKTKVKEDLKKGFAEVANILNSTRRNDNGTLNLANTPPDDSEREKWTLAL